MIFRLLLLATFLQATVLAYTDDAIKDKIENLPGTDKLTIKFNQFSGYLSIPGKDSKYNKKMHYW